MIVFDGKPYTLDRVVRLTLTVGLIWGVIRLLGYLSDVLILLVVPLIINETSHMGTVFSGLVTNSETAERAAQYLPPDIWQGVKSFLVKEEIQDFFKTERFFEMAETVARKLMPGVWGLITGAASFLMGLLGLALIVLYLVFLLIDYNSDRLLPPPLGRLTETPSGTNPNGRSEPPRLLTGR